MIYTFALVISLVILPFYGIYALCGGKLPNVKKSKEKCDSSRSRFEWVAGYLWN